MDIITFIREEVIHQRWDVTKPEGVLRVSWMAEAWHYAMVQQKHGQKFPDLEDVFKIGYCVEKEVNLKALQGEFRKVYVSIGGDTKVAPIDVPHRMQRLWNLVLPEVGKSVTSLEFYEQYEEIHPWGDGNGRSGKVILCWINTTLKEMYDLPVEDVGGTLYDPEFPPDLWGFGLP